MCDREEISRGLVAELTFVEIGARIGRCPSVISRDVRRHGGRVAFRAGDAQAAAQLRRARPKALAVDRCARRRREVQRLLRGGWSPGSAAGKLTSVRDANAMTSTLAYDTTTGLLKSLTDANNHTQFTNTYDPSTKRVTSQVDARGKTTEVLVARIPETELARLKAEVSVQRLVEDVGVSLRRQGSDFVGPCPFHDDNSPSLVVTPAKNLWHCLGACQRGGGPIDWVMTAHGVSFRHAVELLREASPSLSVLAEPKATNSGPVGRSKTAKLPPLVTPDAADQELLNTVVGYYGRDPRDQR